MTIDEFKAVMSTGGYGVEIWRYSWLSTTHPKKYTAALVKIECPNDNDVNPFNYVIAEFSGHTKKAALKKLKDWYYWEARNANR